MWLTESNRIQNTVVGSQNRSKEFVIVKLSSVGDIIHALPVAYTLRKKYPNCKITWITEKLGVQILENNPVIDELITVDTKTWRKWLLNITDYGKLIGVIAATIKTLRKKKYDYAVDLQGLMKSGAILRLLRAGEKWGFPPHRARESYSALFSNRKISDSFFGGHVVDQNLAFAYLMGCDEPVKKIEFYCSEEEKRTIDNFVDSLDTTRNLIAVNPGSGWKTKNWPAENYREICEYCHSNLNGIPVLTWGPGEESLVTPIHHKLKTQTVMAPPTNLRQLSYLLKKCHFAIGGDTGPIHMAAAQNIPVVAIIGPSDPKRNGPMGQNHEILYNPLECSCCYKKECTDPRCITSITVDQVIDALEKMNKKLGRRS